MLYDNEHDAAQYLRNSFVTYKRLPYFVAAIQIVPITRDLICTLQSPRRAHHHCEPFAVKVDDGELNVMNLRLGYIQFKDRAYYTMRRAVRGDGYKQGLCRTNITVHPVANANRAELYDALLNCEGFAKLCRDEYPDVDTAAKWLTEGDGREYRKYESVAISRFYAIEHDPDMEDFTLLHRGERVARSDDARTFKVAAGNAYLIESIQQETKLNVA